VNRLDTERMGHTMASLQSRLFAERTDALAVTTREIEETRVRELEAIRKQTIKVNALAEQRTAEAARKVDETRAQLSSAIVTELHAEIAPLVRAWLHEASRRLANEIGAAFRKFDQRAEQEIGAQLWDGVLGIAFASELIRTYPMAVNQYGMAQNDSDAVDVLYAFRRALGVSAHQVETALANIESLFEQIARGARNAPTEQNMRRFELKRTVATYGDLQKLSAFDAEKRKREREREIQTCEAENVATAQRESRESRGLLSALGL
jgi:hypothetical protein